MVTKFSPAKTALLRSSSSILSSLLNLASRSELQGTPVLICPVVSPTTKLADLEEAGVAGLLVHSHLDTLGVGHGEVVISDLYVGVGGQLGKGL